MPGLDFVTENGEAEIKKENIKFENGSLRKKTINEKYTENKDNEKKEENKEKDFYPKSFKKYNGSNEVEKKEKICENNNVGNNRKKVYENTNNVKICENRKNCKKKKFKPKQSDFKSKHHTEMCKNWESCGFCEFGDKCAYAHGIQELRVKNNIGASFRTRKCEKFFKDGFCVYGSRCQFAHAIKENVINNPYDRKMSYSKTLEMINNVDAIKSISIIFEKPRLNVFKKIEKKNNGKISGNTKSRLLNDIKYIVFNGEF